MAAEHGPSTEPEPGAEAAAGATQAHDTGTAAPDAGAQQEPGGEAEQHAEPRTTGPQDAPRQDAPAQEPAAEAAPIGALGTRDLLAWFLGLLAAKAWEGMGLVPNPESGRLQKNLGDARLAIDAYGALFDAARSGVDEPHRREMETLLTTLRLNFVEKSRDGA